MENIEKVPSGYLPNPVMHSIFIYSLIIAIPIVGLIWAFGLDFQLRDLMWEYPSVKVITIVNSVLTCLVISSSIWIGKSLKKANPSSRRIRSIFLFLNIVFALLLLFMPHLMNLRDDILHIVTTYLNYFVIIVFAYFIWYAFMITAPMRKEAITNTSPRDKVLHDYEEAKYSSSVNSSNKPSINHKDNLLGKSIVKAAWIIFATAVICMSMYLLTKERYTALGDTYFIDQRTGQVHMSALDWDNQRKK